METTNIMVRSYNLSMVKSGMKVRKKEGDTEGLPGCAREERAFFDERRKMDVSIGGRFEVAKKRAKTVDSR